MALIKQTPIQKHPLIWGWLWAAGALALVCLYDYVSGQSPPNLLIALPIWAVAGAGWGYGMKRFFDRRARKR